MPRLSCHVGNACCARTSGLFEPLVCLLLMGVWLLPKRVLHLPLRSVFACSRSRSRCWKLTYTVADERPLKRESRPETFSPSACSPESCHHYLAPGLTLSLSVADTIPFSLPATSGPPSEAMWALGDKISSTIVAQTLQIPTLPWSGSGKGSRPSG